MQRAPSVGRVLLAGVARLPIVGRILLAAECEPPPPAACEFDLGTKALRHSGCLQRMELHIVAFAWQRSKVLQKNSATACNFFQGWVDDRIHKLETETAEVTNASNPTVSEIDRLGGGAYE